MKFQIDKLTALHFHVLAETSQEQRENTRGGKGWGGVRSLTGKQGVSESEPCSERRPMERPDLAHNLVHNEKRKRTSAINAVEASIPVCRSRGEKLLIDLRCCLGCIQRQKKGGGQANHPRLATNQHHEHALRKFVDETW